MLDGYCPRPCETLKECASRSSLASGSTLPALKGGLRSPHLPGRIRSSSSKGVKEAPSRGRGTRATSARARAEPTHESVYGTGRPSGQGVRGDVVLRILDHVDLDQTAGLAQELATLGAEVAQVQDLAEGQVALGKRVDGLDG